MTKNIDSSAPLKRATLSESLEVDAFLGVGSKAHQRECLQAAAALLEQTQRIKALETDFGDEQLKSRRLAIERQKMFDRAVEAAGQISLLEILLREIDSTLYALIESNIGASWVWSDTARETCLRQMKEHRDAIARATGAA